MNLVFHIYMTNWQFWKFEVYFHLLSLFTMCNWKYREVLMLWPFQCQLELSKSNSLLLRPFFIHRIMLHLILNFSGNVMSQNFYKKKAFPFQPRGSEGIISKRVLYTIPRSSNSSNSNDSKDDSSDHSKACMSNY